MTMKRSFADVREMLAELADSVHELAVAIDDCPAADGELAVIEALRVHSADVEGDVRETANAAGLAFAAQQEGDAPRAARLLADAHEHFSKLGHRVRFGLSGHGNLFEVERLPERRGARCRSWSDVVLRQLEQVDHALHHTDAAFVACWQEIVDRAASTVSIANTQKLAVEPRAQHKHPTAI
jgi:hypothetical protein